MRWSTNRSFDATFIVAMVAGHAAVILFDIEHLRLARAAYFTILPNGKALWDFFDYIFPGIAVGIYSGLAYRIASIVGAIVTAILWGGVFAILRLLYIYWARDAGVPTEWFLQPWGTVWSQVVTVWVIGSIIVFVLVWGVVMERRQRRR